MRVTMIGAGYVGLVSGACFADFGHHVTCIDKDPARIAALDRGEIPIFEPGLAELVEANVRQGRLAFAGKAVGVAEADAVMIAVGTPSRRGDGHADLSFVFEAVREIAPLLSRTAIVVTKSTVPVGTGDEIERILREKRPTRRCRSSPIRNSCARAPPSRTSSIRTASWSAPTTRGRARCWPNCTGRLSERRADTLREPPHGGTDQIRRQRLSRHQDHLHQRDRRFVRAGRRRRAGGGARHGARQPHRRQVPACRSGLRRLVFPEGRHRPAQDRARSRRGAAHRRDGRRRQRATQARDGAESRRRPRRFDPRQDRGGAWPDLQAEHRRHPGIRRRSR